MLALVIEAVTGMEFDAFLQQNVFDVCGMTSTGYFELDRLPARCASNYIACPETGGFRTNIFSVDAKGTGAGGAFITVEDVVRFWRSLSENRLLSEETTDTMLSRQSGDGADPEEGWYGYGVWLVPHPGGRDYAYFQGCDPGVSFISEYNRDNGVISVAVSNFGDNVWEVVQRIRKAFY